MSVVGLYVRQRCGELFGRRENFLQSSKYNAHIEGICVLVKWIVGQGKIVVVRLYIDSCVRAVGFGLSRESWSSLVDLFDRFEDSLVYFR